MQKTAPLIFVSGVHLWVGVWVDAYDICGRLLTETNEDGGTTRYFHNRNGLLTKVVCCPTN